MFIDSVGQLRSAVAAARHAQRSWSARRVSRRLAVVRGLRHALAREGPGLASAMDTQMDRRRGETLASEIVPLAEACRFLERKAGRILRPRRPRPYLPALPFLGVQVEIRREPYGVVLVLGPSNYPLFLPAVQALQALVAGSAVLLKPGRGGGEAARALAGWLGEAGLGAPLLVVTGEGDRWGEAAVGAEVDKVVLTGSASTGREVLSKLAPRMLPATVELSGCDAVFVLPGADLELVERAVMFGLTLNGGATCISPRRLFAASDAARRLARRFARSGLQEGRCRVAAGTAAFAAELVEEAVAAGARRLTGRIDPNGACVPVVLAEVSPEMRVCCEDVFAPVLSILEASGPEEALQMARRCPYRLGASVFGPAAAARRFARRVPAGAVVVNDMIAPTADPRLPFGGRDRSGYGVTRGEEGLLEMTRVKALAVRRWGPRVHLRVKPKEAGPVLQDYLRAAHGKRLRRRCRAGWRLIQRALPFGNAARAGAIDDNET